MAPKNKGNQDKSGSKEASGKGKTQANSSSSKTGIIIIDTRDQKDPGSAWKSHPEMQGHAAQKISARQIVCAKAGRAEEALGRLTEGAEFDGVAREFDEDKPGKGGQVSVGGSTSFTRQGLIPAWADLAFALPPTSGQKKVYGVIKVGKDFGGTTHIIMRDGK